MIPRWCALFLLLAGWLAGGEPARPEAKIEGVLIPRGEKGLLALRLAGGGFELRFFSPERRPLVPEVPRAVVRFTPAGRKTGPESHWLELSADGKALQSARIVRPPHGFRVTVLLFAAGAEQPLEVYTAEFRADAG
jgi:hypothetical protein